MIKADRGRRGKTIVRCIKTNGEAVYMLKKTVPVLALVLCLMCSAAGLSEAKPTEKTVPLITEEGLNGEMTLRFFPETPNVPYMGFGEYMTRIMLIPLTPEAEADGTLTLRNEFGGEIRCDAAAGTIFAPDWARMIDHPGDAH